MERTMVGRGSETTIHAAGIRYGLWSDQALGRSGLRRGGCRSLDGAVQFGLCPGVLAEVGRAAGLNPEGARLLRFGENAIFRLAGDSSPVVRIARDLSRLPVARREVCVSRWLAGSGVPTVRVDERFPDQPLVVGGHPVTFWQAVDDGPVRPTLSDLARLLRQLHALETSPCTLPAFDPLVTVWPRLHGGLDLPAADLTFLNDRCHEVAEAVGKLEPVLPLGPIHGDAHTGNLLGGAGTAVLSDFEVFAIGMREWDLIPTAVGQARLGIPAAQLEEFAAGYGFDVRTWVGFPVLRAARELGMTTWWRKTWARAAR